MTLTWNVRYSCAMSVLMLEQPKWSRRCSNAHAAHWKWVHDTFIPCQTQKSAVRLCIITLCKYASCSFAHSLSQVLFSNYALYSDTKVSYSHPCRDSCFDSTRKTFIRQQNKNLQIVHMSTIPAIKASLFCLQKYTHHRNSYQLYILLWKTLLFCLSLSLFCFLLISLEYLLLLF